MARNEKTGSDVTIFDVAREAGVSYATVSRVLNNKGNIKPETRELVLRATARLGYVANQQARSLAGGRSHLIGLLVQDLGNGYMDAIIRGIDQELEAHQYDLLLYTTHRRKTKESAYVTQIARGMADGLLLVLPRAPGAYLDSLRRRRFPYVLIDHQGVDAVGPSVGATNYSGAYEATRYLIELGHRRIGFITGAQELGCAVDRLAGYRAALVDYGVQVDPALIYQGDFYQPAGFAGARTFLELPDRPTAIFASNDVMAFGAMEAIREQGLRIPEDISVVGFDDVLQASSVHPPLTTVRQPMEQMGRLSTRLLLKQIDNPDHLPGYIELPTELVVRQSCQSPATPSR